MILPFSPSVAAGIPGWAVRLRSLLLLATGAASAAACAVGKEPPAVTPMVEFRNVAPFVFGMGELGCNMPQDAKACEAAGTKLPDSTPPMLVKIKDFALDEHEVTNEQYRFCVAMGACSLPAGDNGPPGIVDLYYPNDKYKDYPVILVRWRQAVEYCASVGKRLPTEFEWERAAGGAAPTPQQKRVYPWSSKLGYEPPMQACPNLDVNIRRCNAGNNSTRAVKSSADDVVNDSAGKLYDMAGNVAEFTASDYVANLGCDASQPYTCAQCLTCIDSQGLAACKTECQACTCGDGSAATKPNCYLPCQRPVCPRFDAGDPAFDGSYTGKNVESKRMVRGGSYYGDSEAWQQCDGRSDNRRLSQKPDDQPQTWVGFRCAKSL